jgi:hypothetical protein
MENKCNSSNPVREHVTLENSYEALRNSADQILDTVLLSKDLRLKLEGTDNKSPDGSDRVAPESVAEKFMSLSERLNDYALELRSNIRTADELIGEF